MRVFAAVLLGMSLAASPLLARNAGETGKEDTPVAASASAVPDKPTAVKPEASAIESEMQDLRSLVEEQRAELESQRAALKAQQLKMEALENRLRVAPSEPVAAPVSVSAAAAPAAEPAISATSAATFGSTAAAAPAEPAQKGNDEISPLQLKIGGAYITPVGFLDFTGVWRSKTGGSGIGTNFAGIPYASSGAYQAHLGELRESMQNSRIGFRIDAMVSGAHVIGYMESDYLGNNPGNVAVSSNSNTLRSRLYWVDVSKDKWEILGGQTWSLITPGRSGISPLPGNLFFTQNIDVNYQLGLVWGRIPELRFVVHPNSKVAFAVALDSPEQYGGGSAGGPKIILPAAFTPNTTVLPNTNTNFLAGDGSSGELNFGSTTLNAPNVAPDFIEKLAFDPVSKFHLELGGIERVFKIYDTVTKTSSTKAGAGGFVNLNFELFKGFRLLTNNYWSSGGGRYIFGQAPDLIVRPDGSISPIKAASSVSGFEFTHGKSMLYGYFGGMYVWKNTAIDTTSTPPGAAIGYGVPNNTGQNRFVQEETIGFNQTIWRDAKWGAINFMGQYSYVARNPWYFTTQGEDTHLNMVFLNLRYTLPGSAPTLGK
jgi:hypothetical protein